MRSVAGGSGPRGIEDPGSAVMKTPISWYCSPLVITDGRYVLVRTILFEEGQDSGTVAKPMDSKPRPPKSRIDK